MQSAGGKEAAGEMAVAGRKSGIGRDGIHFCR
jgi:hypothetical protein